MLYDTLLDLLVLNEIWLSNQIKDKMNAGTPYMGYVTINYTNIE